MPTRDEIPLQYQWNLESIYASDELWEEDFRQVEGLLPQLQATSGTLSASPQQLLAALELRDRIGVTMDKMWVYALPRRDEDTTRSHYQAMLDRVTTLSVRAQSASAFFEPEVLALPPETVERYLQEEPRLQVYRHHLDDILRGRPHVRSAEVESLLAQVYHIGRSPSEIFDMLDDADLRYPAVTDEQGQEIELTKGRYQQFMESRDRQVRKNAFQAFYSAYADHRNTLAATLTAGVRKDVFFTRARNYGSCLEAALKPHNIPVAVYRNLLATVERNLPSLHRYLALRKPLLGLDDLHVYDLYVPMVKDVDWSVTYPEACEMVVRGLAPLGPEYVAILQRGLSEDRWVDPFETRGKASGGYSICGYGTHPFILMNWQDKLSSVFTLAHEVGHSMHSYFSRGIQPYVYSSYTLFLAEVASTVNEGLLSHQLLQEAQDPALRMFLVNRQAENFRLTLFRQAMFAEFELAIHEKVERGEPLTADVLSDLYRQLLVKHYGPAVKIDDEVALEWARIPHFYRTFYVYQYATGISAATALVRQILAEGQPAVNRYLKFLGSGSSGYSIDLLRTAGVDMTTPEPVQAALDTFTGLVDQMEELVRQPQA